MSFEEFLRSNGIIPGDIEPGRIMYFATDTHPRKKNGRAMLFPDGKAGWCRNWEHTETVYWKATGDQASHSSAPDPVEIEKRIAERKKEQAKASQEAGAYYNRCRRLNGSHPYLELKGLTVEGCSGCRVSEAGYLVVPMIKDGTIKSIQTISGDGTKRFWPGAPTSRTCYRLSHERSSYTVLVEGLATGLTVFAAMPDASVIVCFDAGNMIKVADMVPRTGWLVVCGDNDHGTEAKTGKNPGMIAAKEAAAIMDAGLAVPDDLGTDWNDFLVDELRRLTETNMTSRHKLRPEMIRRNALSTVATLIRSQAKFAQPQTQLAAPGAVPNG